MKILVLGMKFLPASGGTATYTDNLAKMLRRLGHEVIVIAPRYNRALNDQIFEYKVIRFSNINLKLGQLRIIFAALKLKQLIKKIKPDIIIASTYAGCRVLGFLSTQTPTIGVIHGGGMLRAFKSANPLKWITDFSGHKFLRRASCMVTISKSARDLIASSIKNPRIMNKFKIIYNGISFDESKFLTKEFALEQKPQFKNKIVILTVGRLIKAKGHDVVLKALPELIKSYPNLLYVIVGEGIENESLKQLVSLMSLDEYVYFAGYVNQEELEIYYALSCVFVLAGRWTPTFVEGFGLVFLEAGIRGIPVIGTRVGGIPEAIDENKTGFLIEPDRSDQLLEKLRLLLNNEDLRKAMGEHGKQWVESKFMYKKIARDIDDLMKQTLEKT